MAKKDTQANEHISSYLRYYLSLAYPPQYAVLINGAWGSGKTYFIKRFLEQHFSKPEEYCYVSLYGVQKCEDIDHAILEAIYPLLKNKGMKVAGRVAKAAMTYFRFDPNLKLPDFLEKGDIKLFVFDDLERCEAPLNQILGYINEIVEQDGGRVVIIANDKEISKDAQYTRRREKLIGRVLELQPSFEEAFSYFCSKVQHQKAKELLQENISLIADIYKRSELHNLRILQQTMWDFERLTSIIPDKYYTYSSAIKDVIGLFFPLSIEFKAGHISENDVKDRVNRIVHGQLDKKSDKDKIVPLYEASNKYVTKLYHDILSDDILIDLLAKGIFDATKISALFEASPYFSQKEEPAWRVVWHGLEKTDEEFEPALKEMEKQFQERLFLLPGEITHVFGLRLWLSEIGVLATNKETIVAECKQYVDDLYAQKKLEPTTDNGQSDIRFNGYGGLAIFNNNTDEFKILFEYFENKRALAEKDSYKDIGELLLQQMSAPDKFYQLLCYTRLGDSKYAGVPVLSAINPQTFVDELLKQSPRAQRNIMQTFKGRYEGGRLAGGLKDELVWIKAVKERLVEAAKGLSPLHRYRIINDTKHTINRFVDDLAPEDSKATDKAETEEQD